MKELYERSAELDELLRKEKELKPTFIARVLDKTRKINEEFLIEYYHVAKEAYIKLSIFNQLEDVERRDIWLEKELKESMGRIERMLG